MPGDILQAIGLSFAYPAASIWALQMIDLEIGEGEFVGILGPTGAGKSTLLQCLCGIIPFYTRGRRTGEVSVFGRPITAYRGLDELSPLVNMVLQDPEAQLLNLYVEEELAWGLENYGFPPEEISQRVGKSVQRLNIGRLMGRVTHTLSGGEKQLVVLAAMLALRPKVLLLDEPTSELDPIGTDLVFEAVAALATEGISIVMAEHKIAELARYADRLVVLDEGRIVAMDTPRALFSHACPDVPGLHPPQVAQLGRSLAGYGLPVPTIPLCLEDGMALGKSLLQREVQA